MTSYLKRHVRWIAAVGALLIFAAGILLGRISMGPAIVRNQVLRESGYTYINPVLLCNTNPDQDYNNNKTLQSKIKKFIATLPDDKVSVYYLELKSGGTWAGINENESYSPASMLKVPTMVAILKYADTHADFLSKEVYYDGSFDENKAESFKPQQAIKPRHYYTIDELLTYAIAYSDNNAEQLLDTSIDQHTLENIYINLGIQLPVSETPIDFMSARTYSLFLRILYNSTYLSRDNSEKALGLMAQPDFPQGLQAGVPATIKVAQKFGERQVYLPNGQLQYRELHDCGIVYGSDNPYILCVMTRGQDFNSLTSAIAGVSKTVYDYVTSNP